jgi:hypothetical protein
MKLPNVQKLGEKSAEKKNYHAIDVHSICWEEHVWVSICFYNTHREVMQFRGCNLGEMATSNNIV